MSETTSLSQRPSTAYGTSASVGKAGKQPAHDSDRVCWIQVQGYPYQRDHQVELLHLQAEADALMIKLQAVRRKDAQEN